MAGESKKSVKNKLNWTSETPKAKQVEVPSVVEGPWGAAIKAGGLVESLPNTWLLPSEGAEVLSGEADLERLRLKDSCKPGDKSTL